MNKPMFKTKKFELMLRNICWGKYLVYYFSAYPGLREIYIVTEERLRNCDAKYKVI